MLEIAKIIDRKLQYPCIHNFMSYQRRVRKGHAGHARPRRVSAHGQGFFFSFLNFS